MTHLANRRWRWRRDASASAPFPTIYWPGPCRYIYDWAVMFGNKIGGACLGFGAILLVIALAGLSSCVSRPVKPTDPQTCNATLRQRTLLDADRSEERRVGKEGR